MAVTWAGSVVFFDAPATPAAVETARSFGVDIAGHRSQGFTKELAQSSDLILALAVEHYEAALVMGIPEDKVFMLNAYPRRTRDLYTASIQDPIGGDFDMYRRAFLTIDDALQRSVGDIIRQAVAREKGKENNKE